MANKTSIEWCDSTFNPWIGCTKVSRGCDNCYAERQMDKRLGRVRWGAGQPRQRTSAAYWSQTERLNALGLLCVDCGQRESGGGCPCGQVGAIGKLRRRRVFCASLADVFDNDVPTNWRRDLFDLIARCGNLDFLILTKRIGNVMDMIPMAWLFGTVSRGPWPLPNVWLGATVVNQAEADRDIPKLLATPAAVRFLSVEPMLGPIDIARWMRPRQSGNQDGYGGDHAPGWTSDTRTIDWVIAGGESGPGARPMNPTWAKSLRDQCQDAGIAFFFKQWGAWAPNCLCDKDSACREIRRPEPGERGVMFRCGKAGGREIHGREWSEVPSGRTILETVTDQKLLPQMGGSDG